MRVLSLKNESGLYAYSSPENFTPDSLACPVVGLVAVRGEVMLHDSGFRAKEMQILALAPGNTGALLV